MPDRLTPVDILNIHFPRRMRGYAVADVDEFVRRVASDMEAVLTECAQLKERVNAQDRELTQFHSIEKTMRDALILAQRAADETRTAAQAQAAAQMQEANARLAEIAAHVERLHQERRRLAREFHARLSAQMSWLAEEMEAIPPSSVETGRVVTGGASAEGGKQNGLSRESGSAESKTVEPRTLLHGTSPTTIYSPGFVITDLGAARSEAGNGASHVARQDSETESTSKGDADIPDGESAHSLPPVSRQAPKDSVASAGPTLDSA